MTRKEIIERFQNLNIWKSKDQRAVHKPLLVLYAIGKLLRGEDRLISYADAEDDLRNLLKEFGPTEDQITDLSTHFGGCETKKTKSGKYLMPTKFRNTYERMEHQLVMLV